jgi:membrane-associated protease RseP (regulator of RpoE activity)
MSRRLVIALGAVAAALLIGIGAVGALLISGGNDNDNHESAPSSSGTGKGYLGLTVTVQPSQGLRVASVESDGPAAKAGIQVGDSIQSVDGQVVRTPEQLRNAVEAKKPGTQVTLTYIRADQELRATVKLAEEPANAQIEVTPTPNAQVGPLQRGGAGQNGLGRGQLGVQVQNITAQLKQQYNLSKDSGVVITQVESGSAADRAGLKAGDVIESVNGSDVSTVADATRAIVGSATGQQTVVKILRGSNEMTVNVQLTAASLFPGFENLPPAVQERLQQLAQAGNLTPEQLQSLGTSYQNNLRVGTVKSIDSTSISITLLETTTDVTYALNGMTQYRAGLNQITVTDIAVGNTVAVLSLDGKTALAVLIINRQ